MSRQLFEAAQSILSKSQSSAPQMPSELTSASGVSTEIVGDTPTHHNDTKPNLASPVSKVKTPGNSAPLGDMGIQGKDRSTDDALSDDEIGEGSREGKTVKEDLESLFDSEEISEDFRNKAATIFEARVFDRVSQIQEELETKYQTELEESVTALTEQLTESVNDYLNYVVEEWMTENSIAIEKGLRTELTEEFLVGLRNLFTEHYIDIPDEKVDVVEELSEQVSELENQLNEQIESSIALLKQLNESKKNEVISYVTKGLIETQAEKIRSLAESVEFTTEEEFEEKLETIKENYFPSVVKRSTEAHLHESLEDSELGNPPKALTPAMEVYTAALARSLPKN